MLLTDDASIRKHLSQARTIAVVGANDKPGRPSDMIGRYLMNAGYRVIPVHPKRQEVWGLKAYSNVVDIPEQVDIVNLFRASEYCAGHAREIAALSPRPGLMWMQLGIANDEAVQTASEASVDAVQDKCIMVEHERLFA